MNAHEGPTRVTPATPRPRLDCSGCKYLHRQLVKSGRNPTYHSLCQHPSARVHPVLDADGQQISREGKTETPGWCPVVIAREDGRICGRGACGAVLERGGRWFNSVTRRHYCRICAKGINAAARSVDMPALCELVIE